MADKARRDIGGARWDLETSDGVVCSSAGRKELKLKCKMRASLTGSNRLCQEGFQASWHDSDTF